MFLGNHSHTIDTKGRMIIPAKMREELGERCIITQGFDNCLAVYSLELFQQKADKLSKMSTTKSTVRILQRHFFGNAAEVEFDRQGRILVPTNLRKFAGLGKEVVVVGQSNFIEIWSRERWDTYTATTEGSVEMYTESLEDLDF
ncbi:MAG: division/cell wall cluster transcriptional repressor MraZ [Veillonella sp.]|uniref:division/cell wall cluster transcriptional repressor MraZ n=1 Tax=Veillonella sp. TaxID=1926307 RepID=UPI0025FAAA88|nr:division/cell wall cluster transcriptional repressor MraZ [Veillonella sp.]MBS4913744.1 division/cell wall cluster transcriptional repressor MraZ [Veillonella sp.]